MALGPTLTRGARRRRVLTEELLGSATTAADQSAPAEGQTRAQDGAGVSRYTIAAAYENQSRVSDLVPRWRITIVLLWFFGGALVAALVELHLHQANLAAMLEQPDLQALDLVSLCNGTAGGLGVWFASSALGLASMACLLIYSIRRHRIDDYHGRYRIWLWIAAICLLMSINTSVGVHAVLVRTGIDQTGWSALAGGAVWWLVPLALLAATFGLRLLAEVRQCRTSCMALLAAYACWTTAIVTHLGLLAVGDPLITIAVVAGGTLAGHVLLLTALAFYARYVVLDADGLLPQRHQPCESDDETESVERATPVRSRVQAKPSKPSPRQPSAKPPKPQVAAKHAQPAAGRRRTDLDPTPPVQPKPADRDTERQWTQGADEALEADDGDDGSQSGSRKLSKTERKRLRKQRQRDRQRHAA
jgi:hypothetical protein